MNQYPTYDPSYIPKPSYSIPNGKNIGQGKVVAIKAMRELGMSYGEIAKRAKVSYTTARFISRAEVHNPLVIERIKKYAAANWWITQHNALEAITPEKLQDSSALQLGTLAAISTEKARLIEGDTTQNIGFVDKSDAELEKEIQDLELQLARANAITIRVDNPPQNSPEIPLETASENKIVSNQVIPDTQAPPGYNPNRGGVYRLPPKGNE